MISYSDSDDLIPIVESNRLITSRAIFKFEGRMNIKNLLDA